MVEVVKKNRVFYLLVGIILYGMGLRIKMLLDHQSLFLDEANVARNLFELSYTDLFGILKYDQYVPPLFSAFTKFLGDLFGYSEVVLRFLPLLSSFLAIVFLFKLLREFVPIKFTLMPITILAGGFIFLKYSIEVKQYTTEFAIGCFLLWYAIHSKIKSSYFYIKWAMIGIISIYASFTSIFFLTGIGIYFFIELLQKKGSTSQFLRLILMGLSWVSAFGLYYYYVLSVNIKNPGLISYHEQFYLKPPFSLSAISQNYQIIAQNLHHLSKITYPLYFMILSGIILGIKSFGNKMTPIILPLFFVIIASMMHKFTFIQRVVLPFYSIGLFFLGLGIYLLINMLSQKIQNRIILFSFIMVIGTVDADHIVGPYKYQEMRSGIEYLQSKIDKNDKIWVVKGASTILAYYSNIHPEADRFTLPKEQFIQRKDLPSVNAHHIFILMASIYPHQIEEILQMMQPKYEQIDLRDFNGVLLYEFTLKQPN